MSEIKSDELLKRYNIRPNRNRVSILDEILRCSYTVSALELLDRLKDIDKTTIYRTLDLFEEKGIVMKVIDPEGVSHYCNRLGNSKPHLHFYCKRCHKTECKSIDNLPEFNIVDEQVENIEIKITGVCKICKEKVR